MVAASVLSIKYCCVYVSVKVLLLWQNDGLTLLRRRGHQMLARRQKACFECFYKLSCVSDNFFPTGGNCIEIPL